VRKLRLGDGGAVEKMTNVCISLNSDFTWTQSWRSVQNAHGDPDKLRTNASATDELIMTTPYSLPAPIILVPKRIGQVQGPVL
jgi:hypothetical protein